MWRRIRWWEQARGGPNGEKKPQGTGDKVLVTKTGVRTGENLSTRDGHRRCLPQFEGLWLEARICPLHHVILNWLRHQEHMVSQESHVGQAHCGPGRLEKWRPRPVSVTTVGIFESLDHAVIDVMHAKDCQSMPAKCLRNPFLTG